MKLYHGSKQGGLAALKKRQAQAGEGVDVPKDELLEAVYLTPDYGYALAMAARPDGVTQINTVEKKIEFDNPDNFNPGLDVYVYEVDIPDDQVRQVDELQYVVESADKIKVLTQHAHKSGDVGQYYEIVNRKKEGQDSGGFEMKFR